MPMPLTPEPRAREKIGYGRLTSATAEAVAVLEEARKRNRGIGDASVLPRTKDPSRCITHAIAAGWWRRAGTLAGLEPKRGRGWHSLIRKFASDLMDQPLKVLCELGGWKTARPCSSATSGPTRRGSGRRWSAAPGLSPERGLANTDQRTSPSRYP